MQASKNRIWCIVAAATAAVGLTAWTSADPGKKAPPAKAAPVAKQPVAAKPAVKRADLDPRITTSNMMPKGLRVNKPANGGLRGPGCAACPGGGTAENEPDCGLPTDTVNGGCNSTPPVFSPIAVGQTVCGTGAFDSNIGFRDTDWYQVTIATPTELTWTVTAEFPILIGMIASPCPATAFIAGTPQFAPACATISSVKCLNPGTYYMFVANDFSVDTVCGISNNYFATLTGVACTPPLPPANDTCTTAEAITSLPATVFGDTTAAGADSAPTCGTTVSAPGVWYRLTGVDGTIELDLCNSSYDTKVNVYCLPSGADCATGLLCIGGNDDAAAGNCAGTLQSYLTFCASASNTYYILVQGFGGDTGAYSMNVSNLGSCTGTPCAGAANDNCATATVLAIPSSVSGNNSNASGTAEATPCDAFNRVVTNAVWYRFTGTGNTVQLNSCGSTLDTIINVYTGTCASLTCVGGNDDATAGPCVGTLQSFLEVATTLGQTYYVTMSGYLGGTGAYTLSIVDLAPTGACCVTGGCSITTQAACSGSWLGANTTCSQSGSSNNYSSTPNLPIPDANPAGVSDIINVGTSYNIQSMNVTVSIPNHTWIGDLIIDLTHGATTVRLWNRQCGSQDGLTVTFQDGAPNVVCAQPTSGTYAPFQPLSAFAGADASGGWTLTVSDNAGTDIGTLVSWGMTITSAGVSNCVTGPDCFTANAGQQGGMWVRGGANGVADNTECIGDWDRNGPVEPADIAAYVNTWLFSVSNPGNTYADIDCNGTAEPADIAYFVNNWLAGLTPGTQGCP